MLKACQINCLAGVSSQVSRRPSEAVGNPGSGPGLEITGISVYQSAESCPMARCGFSERMCGIAGFSLHGPGDWSVETMIGCLTHRGPDGCGTWKGQQNQVSLGQTRLAIIDLAGGQQPMKSWDDIYVITFNGEIYNYRDLRAELEAAGHRFHTQSDTEVVIEGYRRWGADCLLRLRGMFAFALHDTKHGEMFIARDRTGIKPLYYYDGPAGFAFASEMKAILALHGIPRRLDLQALCDFLVLGYPLLPRTMFSDIREFPPGHYLHVEGSVRRWGRYWRWQHRPAVERIRCFDDALAKTRESLIASVREHLVADVPVGAQLSGGIDSSLVAAIVTKELGRQISTYTVSFADGDFNEGAIARETARLLGTDHHDIHLDHGGVELVERVIDQFDQPFADSSAIPSWLLSSEIRKFCKVVLSGDGGDEMFGGYVRFGNADLARILGRFVSPAANLLEASLPYVVPRADLVRGGRRMLRAAAAKDGRRLRALSNYVWAEDLPAVLAPDLAGRLPPDPVPFPPDEAVADPGGEAFVDATVRYALPGDYLRKVDITSGAHGLEVGVPFLGEHVLDCGAAIENDIKYNRHQNKRLLRRLAEEYLPSSVTTKPKSGFTIPLDSWISSSDRNALRDSVTDPASPLQGIIAPDYRREMLTGFATGTWDEKRHSRYMVFQKSYQLWCLERWLRRWKPSVSC
jgi:asparagine synthase (glutamine-hydrolysing)